VAYVISKLSYCTWCALEYQAATVWPHLWVSAVCLTLYFVFCCLVLCGIAVLLLACLEEILLFSSKFAWWTQSFTHLVQ
jgi:hypothetical protein